MTLTLIFDFNFDFMILLFQFPFTNSNIHHPYLKQFIKIAMMKFVNYFFSKDHQHLYLIINWCPLHYW